MTYLGEMRNTARCASVIKGPPYTATDKQGAVSDELRFFAAEIEWVEPRVMSCRVGSIVFRIFHWTAETLTPWPLVIFPPISELNATRK